MAGRFGIDLGRANPLLTYFVGIFLGWSVTSSEGGTAIVNGAFIVVVFALVVLGEMSHRGDAT